MEIQSGAVCYRCIVTKKIVLIYGLKLLVCYYPDKLGGESLKPIEVVVRRGRTKYEIRRYREIERLRPGDELYVDPLGEEWCNPKYRNFFRRMWNLFIV